MDSLVLAEHEQSSKACGLWAGSGLLGLRRGVPAKPQERCSTSPGFQWVWWCLFYTAGAKGSVTLFTIVFASVHTLSKLAPRAYIADTLAGDLLSSRPEGHLGGHSHTYIFSGIVPIPCRFRCSIEECLKDSLGAPQLCDLGHVTQMLCASVSSSVKWERSAVPGTRFGSACEN